MKIKHKINIPWDYVPPSHVETDDRYLAELETARRKAEKAWRKAQQDLARAERRLAAKPDPELRAAQEAALREFEAREKELREIERLMRGPESGQARVVQRTGRDNRLEIGEYRPPKRKKGKPQPVRVRQGQPNPPCKTCRGKPPAGFACRTCGTEGGPRRAATSRTATPQTTPCTTEPSDEHVKPSAHTGQHATIEQPRRTP